MPVRSPSKKYEVSSKETKEVVDIDFLPENIKDKVYEAFDRYFGFGLLHQLTCESEELPAFPNSAASLDSDEIGNYLGEFTAWYVFTADKKKYMGVAANVLEREMDLVYRKSLSTMTTKANLEIKKCEAKSTTEYLELEEYSMMVENIVYMLDIELQKLDKAIASLSREVSRRERYSGN